MERPDPRIRDEVADVPVLRAVRSNIERGQQGGRVGLLGVVGVAEEGEVDVDFGGGGEEGEDIGGAGLDVEGDLIVGDFGDGGEGGVE